jgi:hypothetical protein
MTHCIRAGKSSILRTCEDIEKSYNRGYRNFMPTPRSSSMAPIMAKMDSRLTQIMMRFLLPCVCIVLFGALTAHAGAFFPMDDAISPFSNAFSNQSNSIFGAKSHCSDNANLMIPSISSLDDGKKITFQDAFGTPEALFATPPNSTRQSNRRSYKANYIPLMDPTHPARQNYIPTLFWVMQLRITEPAKPITRPKPTPSPSSKPRISPTPGSNSPSTKSEKKSK